ncbi:hypothetical protein AMTRI_Chr03g45670 [Amborella trichopoda]|uniref:Non-structural maintenance of chromosomes element 4 n=1 Tax=Amborella trichopoda TaxID=13333 RepID=W1NTK0_AMBTC|nr:non-structural maintenance of chromosomes element 4 homolog A [Amborella trichopoda]XP_020519685.1 non-structural maintenance of chromosomes element 4 homolog A [Amborella trichopoda]XP_020519686.1 non-structural maintenance of chromosomes element 4 homolog A [Amborella trichopoda]ERN00857.1 hypothetical protein AMTR_s00103p00104910 [Amborella trichopoda]|eukprot:XP_006838288.1 non-structural maintenance of chromosomes element 4 homolog A [Amborella trichopoda]
MVKKEKHQASTSKEPSSKATHTDTQGNQSTTERRVLRSRYLAVKNLINDERDEITCLDSDKFKTIISEVESLHRHVEKPREQVADAEALLDIANTLLLSVKSQNSEGVTPSDFITKVIKKFGKKTLVKGASDYDSLSWVEFGHAVSHIFRAAPSACTMLGPMDIELKPRRTVVQRKRVRPTERTRPEELEEDPQGELKSDTDRNMVTMFDILRKRKRIRLENLILNRASFAQTVENIFALSFLVKDGRAAISIGDEGYHFVAPRNAPAANDVATGEVSYNHFVFRFDFKDWKMMIDTVPSGEEAMPYRNAAIHSGNTQVDPTVHFGNSQGNPAVASIDSQAAPTTPIRKLSRNRGLVINDSNIDSTPESDDFAGKHHKRKSRRHL